MGGQRRSVSEGLSVGVLENVIGGVEQRCEYISVLTIYLVLGGGEIVSVLVMDCVNALNIDVLLLLLIDAAGSLDDW